MANVQIKSEKVTAFGGIFHVMDVFERLGLGKLVDSSLGDREHHLHLREVRGFA